MEQGDGKLAYGVFVQNGRLKGELKQALRTVIERYELPVLLTANQNIILTEIEPSWKADILNTLQAAGVRCALPFVAAPLLRPFFGILRCRLWACGAAPLLGCALWSPRVQAVGVRWASWLRLFAANPGHACLPRWQNEKSVSW